MDPVRNVPENLRQRMLSTIASKAYKPLKPLKRNNMRTLRQRSIAQGETLLPVRLMPTLDDGDCFYSSIYRAVQERPGLLQRLSRFLNMRTDSAPSEAEFIWELRHCVADRLLADAPTSELYSRLVEVADMNSESYYEQMQQYPNWFVREFGSTGTRLGTMSEFYTNLVKHIIKPKTWVGQIEVEVVEKILKEAHIRIHIVRTMVWELPKREGDYDSIWLYNPGELHYEYFSFIRPHSTIPKRTHTTNVNNSHVYSNSESNSSNSTHSKKSRRYRTRRRHRIV